MSAAVEPLPPAVLAAIADGGATVIGEVTTALVGSTGAATAAVDRLDLQVRAARGRVVSAAVVRKRLRPLTSGRHAAASRAADHWAYWRRELLAYSSGLLPRGPGIAAPGLVAIDGDVLYLEVVEGEPERPALAARRLGQWQARTAVPDLPWLARHQLAQRIAVTSLDWAAVGADPRLAEVWDRRAEIVAELETLPVTVVHGDFSAGNLVAADEATTVALDWATFGTGPVGADLASLTLSTGEWLLEEYLAGLEGACPAEAARHGYVLTMAVAHASRAHWALSRGIAVDPALTELVLRAV